MEKWLLRPKNSFSVYNYLRNFSSFQKKKKKREVSKKIFEIKFSIKKVLLVFFLSLNDVQYAY